MTKLHQLFDEYGQSPWLDNLTRGSLRDGTLRDLVRRGVRGVTANPTIFGRAITSSHDYDDQFRALRAAGRSVTDSYWELVIADVQDACELLRPTFEGSGTIDGFVSIEVAPEIARDTAATIAAARRLHERVARPNAYVKIPATAEGIAAIRAMAAEGRNINVTLIFSLDRYADVIEAYLSGLEAFVDAGGDASGVHGVASFFVSRVDTEVDRRLDTIGDPAAAALRGRAAIAQAVLAYQLFRARFTGPRWERLAARGAHVQRPLWASTSTKDPAYPDTRYVDGLIGPDTINTLTEATIAAFEDHGQLARTVDTGVADAHEVMRGLEVAGIDIEDVARTLESQGIASFHESFEDALGALDAQAQQMAIG